MNLLLTGMALLIASAAFIGYDALTFRTVTMRNLSIRTHVIGSNSVSAILFNDEAAATSTLSAQQADAHVISAAIYNIDGSLFAAYRRSPGAPLPPMPGNLSTQLDTQSVAGRTIAVSHVIVSDGRPVGVVCILSDIQALYQRLFLYFGIGFVVLFGSLLASLFVASIFNRSFTRPIVHLAESVRIVSRDKTYSLRVDPVPGKGEISVLIDAFNAMMARIERNEADLQRAHDELEHRVEERTAELLAAQQRVEAYSESVVRAKEEVERASRFKDQFLSTMSHELRTPLNAVLGFSELLTDPRYGPLNERQLRYVNHIHVSGQHLLKLINDILDLSKIEAGRMQLTIEEVPVQASFSEVEGALQSLVDKKGQTLRCSASDGLTVRADTTRFKQILLNLLGNAIKFTPEGGILGLSAVQDGEFVRVEVRDSGPGIAPEERQRIFDAFHRSKQADKTAEGTGLGLAITRRLVEMHGGSLGLDSEIGVGSCFYFTIPAAPRALASEPSGPARDASAQPTITILVIEDDSASADLLESQLTPAGYKVTVCTHPQMAIETAAALQPGVITLDIVMLPVNGWDILSSLKSDPRTAHIPVVVVSVMDQRETGALLGADEYIVKPVDRAILLTAVERSLNHRQQRSADGSILVVEDDAPTREMIVEILSSRGYPVQSAADGEQARGLVQASLPALVILDLILPGASGLQLVAEWRADARTECLPILVLTSKDLTPAEKDYLHSNTVTYFSKQEQWNDKLVQQIRKTVPHAPAGES